MPYRSLPSDEGIFLGPTRTEGEWHRHLQELRDEGVSEFAVQRLEKMGRVKYAQRLRKTWERRKIR